VNFAYWKKGLHESIYINGVVGFSGKCYFRKTSDGKLSLVVSSGSLTQEQREGIYSAIESEYGVLVSEVGFDVFAKLTASPKNKTSEKPKSGAFYSPPMEGDRYAQAEAIDILTMKIPETIHIRIDHREPKKLVEILSSHPRIEVTVESLELGDIIINNTIIIERKDCTSEAHSTDFECSVLDDKRIFIQSERLKMQDEFIPIFLLEGNCHKNSLRMSLPQIDGAISFLAIVQNLSVLTTLNLTHTAYMIAKLGTHQKSGLSYEVGLRAKKPERLLDKKSFVLEGVKGINAKIAKDLLAHFGSVRNVVNASEAELLKVKGLGKAKVANLLAVFE